MIGKFIGLVIGGFISFCLGFLGTFLLLKILNKKS